MFTGSVRRAVRTKRGTCPVRPSGGRTAADGSWPRGGRADGLAELYARILGDIGCSTSVTTVKNRELCEASLEKGEIDVVPEYAATITEFLNAKVNGAKAAEEKPLSTGVAAATVTELRKLAGPRGLKVLPAGRAVDRNAFAVTKEFADKNKLKTLSDLGESKIEVKIAAGDECAVRPFCAPGLKKTYGIQVSGIDPRGVGTPQSKQAVKDGVDQVVLSSTTDGTLDSFGLVVLEDDKKLQNTDNVLPVVNAKDAETAGTANALGKLTSAPTTDDLAKLNLRVDVERAKPEDVAKEYPKAWSTERRRLVSGTRKNGVRPGKQERSRTGAGNRARKIAGPVPQSASAHGKFRAMPRGRHRHSPPLHKLLPPTAVAGTAVLCAAGAWLFRDALILRGLVTVTAAAAVSGAVIMRGWDRSAGRRVAELTRGRENDHWKTEERIAELEADIEESREMRLKIDAKLRSKRIELAGLRNEHAALLRRYANAETERASALEGRRRLALRTAAGARTPLPAGGVPAGGAADKAAYLDAARALDELSRNAAAQQAGRTGGTARARGLAEPATEAEEPQGKHGAAAGAEQHRRPSAALPVPRVPGASAIVPYSPQHRQIPRAEGSFDFFGSQCPQVASAIAAAGATEDSRERTEDPSEESSVTWSSSEAVDPADTSDRSDLSDRPDASHESDGSDSADSADGSDPADASDKPDPADRLARVEREDLADVVGEEALAERRETGDREAGRLIDLTAHDETEPFQLGDLRDAISS
jgi:osmoprotectant transport system substrate-binding protein